MPEILEKRGGRDVAMVGFVGEKKAWKAEDSSKGETPVMDWKYSEVRN